MTPSVAIMRAVTECLQRGHVPRGYAQYVKWQRLTGQYDCSYAVYKWLHDNLPE